MSASSARPFYLEGVLHQMQLENLSIAEVRRFMIEEMQNDVDQNNLYESPRLSAAGRARYPVMLRGALATGTPETLARQLSETGVLNATETRQTKNGPITAKIPVTAPETDLRLTTV